MTDQSDANQEPIVMGRPPEIHIITEDIYATQERDSESCSNLADDASSSSRRAQESQGHRQPGRGSLLGNESPEARQGVREVHRTEHSGH